MESRGLNRAGNAVAYPAQRFPPAAIPAGTHTVEVAPSAADRANSPCAAYKALCERVYGKEGEARRDVEVRPDGRAIAVRPHGEVPFPPECFRWETGYGCSPRELERIQAEGPPAIRLPVWRPIYRAADLGGADRSEIPGTESADPWIAAELGQAAVLRDYARPPELAGTYWIQVGLDVALPDPWAEDREADVWDDGWQALRDGRRVRLVAIDPREPECDRAGLDPGDPLEHDWVDSGARPSRLDAAGSWYGSRCRRCALGRETNDWARDEVSNEEGLTQIRYRRPSAAAALLLAASRELVHVDWVDDPGGIEIEGAWTHEHADAAGLVAVAERVRREAEDPCHWTKSSEDIDVEAAVESWQRAVAAAAALAGHALLAWEHYLSGDWAALREDVRRAEETELRLWSGGIGGSQACLDVGTGKPEAPTWTPIVRALKAEGAHA